MAGDAIKNPESTTMRRALEQLLDVEDGDDGEFFRRMAVVYELPKTIRNAVVALPGVNHDLLLSELYHVERALPSNNFNAAWIAFQRAIPGSTRYSLKVIADTLDRLAPETKISEQQRDDILDQVRELLDEIAVTDLENDLRLFLTRQLQAMEQAIEEVRIRGEAALREVAERVVGAVVVRTQTKGGPSKGGQGFGLWKRMIGIVNDVIVLINLAGSSLALGENLLGPPELPGPPQPT